MIDPEKMFKSFMQHCREAFSHKPAPIQPPNTYQSDMITLLTIIVVAAVLEVVFKIAIKLVGLYLDHAQNAELDELEKFRLELEISVLHHQKKQMRRSNNTQFDTFSCLSASFERLEENVAERMDRLEAKISDCAEMIRQTGSNSQNQIHHLEGGIYDLHEDISGLRRAIMDLQILKEAMSHADPSGTFQTLSKNQVMEAYLEIAGGQNHDNDTSSESEEDANDQDQGGSEDEEEKDDDFESLHGQ